MHNQNLDFSSKMWDESLCSPLNTPADELFAVDWSNRTLPSRQVEWLHHLIGFEISPHTWVTEVFHILERFYRPFLIAVHCCSLTRGFAYNPTQSEKKPASCDPISLCVVLQLCCAIASCVVLLWKNRAITHRFNINTRNPWNSKAPSWGP